MKTLLININCIANTFIVCYVNKLLRTLAVIIILYTVNNFKLGRELEDKS